MVYNSGAKLSDADFVHKQDVNLVFNVPSDALALYCTGLSEDTLFVTIPVSHFFANHLMFFLFRQDHL